MMAYGYSRVSTQYQNEQGNLKIQNSKIMDYCKSKKIQLINIYSDVRSGMNENIKETNLNKILKLCIKKKCLLIITHIDRLTRNVKVFDRIIKRKIKLISIYKENATIEELRKDVEFASKEPELIKQRRKMVIDKLKHDVSSFKCSRIYSDVYTCAFDIETTSLSADIGKIKVISLIVDNGKKYIFINTKKNVFIENCKIVIFNTEKKLISHFLDTLRQFIPSIVLGFNSSRFDWRFVRERCEILEITMSPLRFGRINGFHYITKDDPKKSLLITNIDLKIFCDRFLESRNRSLNSVAKKYISETKIPMPTHKLLYYLKNDKNMDEVALYCLQDSQLLIKLEEKLRSFEMLRKKCIHVGLTIHQILSNIKKFHHCSLVETLLTSLTNIYDTTCSISECNRILHFFLNGLKKGDISTSSLYYSVAIEAKFFNPKSKYYHLVCTLRKAGMGKIGEMAYFTYTKNGIVSFGKDINIKNIDINKIYAVSLKNRLLKFYETKTVLNVNEINLFLKLDTMITYLEKHLKLDTSDTASIKEPGYFHIVDIWDVISTKSKSDIKNKYGDHTLFNYEKSYISRLIYHTSRLVLLLISSQKLNNIDEICCYFPDVIEISNICDVLLNLFREMGIQILNKEEVTNSKKVRKLDIEILMNKNLDKNEFTKSYLGKKLTNLAAEYKKKVCVGE